MWNLIFFIYFKKKVSIIWDFIAKSLEKGDRLYFKKKNQLVFQLVS